MDDGEWGNFKGFEESTVDLKVKRESPRDKNAPSREEKGGEAKKGGKRGSRPQNVKSLRGK